jgi:hypothetical protein
MTEVLINGVRYVPAENLPDEVQFYYSDRTEEDSHCLADDPDAMCAACDCWKKTREFCG